MQNAQHTVKKIKGGGAGSKRGPSDTKIESNKLYKANHFVIPIE